MSYDWLHNIYVSDNHNLHKKMKNKHEIFFLFFVRDYTSK